MELLRNENKEIQKMTCKIKLSPHEILSLCEEFKNRRLKYIKELREEYIQRQMAPRLFGLLRARSREEVLKDVAEQDGGLWNDWGLIKLHGGYAALQVEQLISLATIAQNSGINEVSIDAELAHILTTH